MLLALTHLILNNRYEVGTVNCLCITEGDTEAQRL